MHNFFWVRLDSARIFLGFGSTKIRLDSAQLLQLRLRFIGPLSSVTAFVPCVTVLYTKPN